MTERAIQLLAFGLIAVLDTAALFVLFEKRNFRRLILPVILLVAGVWIYHVATFFHALLEDAGAWAASFHVISMSGMALGAFMMPCAMLHAVLQIRSTGLEVAAPRRRRWCLAYLPLLMVVPVFIRFQAAPHARFLDSVTDYLLPYLVFLTAVNAFAVYVFWRADVRKSFFNASKLGPAMAISIAVVALVHLLVLLVLLPAFPARERLLTTMLVASPILPTLCFLWYALRHGLLSLVVERTVLYGAIVAGVILIHRVVLSDVIDRLGDHLRVDLALIEFSAVFFFLLVYRPTRARLAEALRYLFGPRAAETRRQVRHLAAGLSARSGESPAEIAAWFSDAAASAFGAGGVGVWFEGDDGRIAPVAGSTARLGDAGVAGLRAALLGSGTLAGVRGREREAAMADALATAEADLAVTLDHPRIRGLVAFFDVRGGAPLSEETASAAATLVEMLGVALDASLLQAERLDAERRAFRNERLSALGLVASSVAHEVKNPLSSIRTLAQCLEEELEDGARREDLRVMRSEIDRLAETVTGMLRFAGAAGGVAGAETSSAAEAVSGTLAIMRHLAVKEGVGLQADVDEGIPDVAAPPGVLREILFNLVGNAIEAAPRGGVVSVACRRCAEGVELRVADNGPGIAADIEARLFEPFASTKVSGTGLGLYIVGRHVRELAGHITCDSDGDGTEFIVTLPEAGQ